MITATTSVSGPAANAAGENLRFYGVWLAGVVALIVLPLVFSSGGSHAPSRSGPRRLASARSGPP